MREAYAQIDDTRPTVIIAYTVKGNGLPTEGHPQNHSSLLTIDQYRQLAHGMGENPDAPWTRFDPASTEGGQLVGMTAETLQRSAQPAVAPPSVPADFGRTPSGTATTQAALGRTLLDVTRAAPDVARRLVTVSPDVSSSTNLAGWLNKVGVWSVEERRNWFSDDTETVMHWREKPQGSTSNSA